MRRNRVVIVIPPLNKAQSIAEVLAHIPEEYRDCIARNILAHGRSIDKYLANVVLAHCGGIGLNIGFGIAITMGKIVFGGVGHDERREITVLRESVNLSAKLGEHTKRVGCRTVTTKMTFAGTKTHGFKPKVPVSEVPGSRFDGIPYAIGLVGLD